jgi:spore coat protein H
MRAMTGKLLCFVAAAGLCSGVGASGGEPRVDHIDGPSLGLYRLRVEIPPEGMAVLQEYHQVWRQQRPERVDVRATIREGNRVYTNVAIHLKGSFSFQPIDAKPSLTLNFEKFAPGQRFHGLSKIHLNNSVQDDTYLCEQFARELFDSLGVPAPRAGHASVTLNGRRLGLYVIIEGANKQFLKRYFTDVSGNLYDGGSGGEITSALQADSGDEPEDRSDLKRLAQATREVDPGKRLTKLQAVLDVDRFVTFAAVEAFLVHWDGYSVGQNNYRVFHDKTRDKMIFIPHGLDQLFGVSRSIGMSITPAFKGLVAKALFSIPETRRTYLEKIEELSKNELRPEVLHQRIDKLASELGPAFDPNELAMFQNAVVGLKARITQRSVNVAQQLRNPKRPLQIVAGQAIPLAAWAFKPGTTAASSGGRRAEAGRDILSVVGRGPGSSGSWRTTVLLESGKYELTGSAKSEGLTVADLQSTNGVMIRASGERSTKGIAISDDWKELSYEFEVHGIEDVELVCEFRGASGSGFFDARSIRLRRK